MPLSRIPALLLALAFTSLPTGLTAAAEIYRWVDADGKVHFSDQPSPAHKSEALELRINTYRQVTYDRVEDSAGAQIVMYSASWCGVCKQARQYFAQQGLPYEEYDVETSRRGKADFERLGGQGVPVILVGNRRMNGFSAAGLQQLLR